MATFMLEYKGLSLALEYLKILVLSNYHTEAVFSGTKCEHCLSSIGSDLSVRNLHLV